MGNKGVMSGHFWSTLHLRQNEEPKYGDYDFIEEVQDPSKYSKDKFTYDYGRGPKVYSWHRFISGQRSWAYVREHFDELYVLNVLAKHCDCQLCSIPWYLCCLSYLGGCYCCAGCLKGFSEQAEYTSSGMFFSNWKERLERVSKKTKRE